MTARGRICVRRRQVREQANLGLKLLLPVGYPLAIGAALESYASGPRIPVDPPGHSGHRGPRVLVLPFRRKRELDIPVTPRAGDRPALSGAGRPRAGNRGTLAVEVQISFEAAVVGC